MAIVTWAQQSPIWHVSSSTPIPCGKVLEVAQEVAHTEASARRLAGVGGSNALLGGSNTESQ